MIHFFCCCCNCLAIVWSGFTVDHEVGLYFIALKSVKHQLIDLANWDT